ncbi:hypothetical protein [Streptomyces sp. ATCC 21386]|uniref:hypothetical protein n=1 Tax=Streptomyces sp. ATCC 21386 TaxID=2699428 RepID=UPI001BFF4235|nr:hypothetical protein [Streptomyces sp. ATCC 21386]
MVTRTPLREGADVEASTFHESPFQVLTRDGSRGAGVTVRAFWWGFHVELTPPGGTNSATRYVS